MADEKTQIITDEKLQQVFTAKDEAPLNAMLAAIKEQVSGHEPDLSTGAKRAKITALSSRVGASRSKIDGYGKTLGDAYRAKIEVFNTRRNIAKDFLAELKTEVRDPLTKWEECEAERKADHEATIVQIEDTLTEQGASSAVIEKAIESLDEICTLNMQEYQERADAAKARTLETLNHRLTAAKESEAREAELEALRAEKAEREQADEQRREEEAQARRDAEAEEARKVEADRIREEERAAAQRQIEEAEAAKAKAEREAAEAVERERAEREAAQKAEAVAELKRKHDAAHREALTNDAVNALIGAGVSRASAPKAVAAIIAGTVPNITMKF